MNCNRHAAGLLARCFLVAFVIACVQPTEECAVKYRATLTRLLRAAMLLLITLAAVADGRSATAQGAVLGPHTWQIQVDNVSPEGHTWSFNASPITAQAHVCDTIVLRVAQNPNAMHLPVFLHAGFLRSRRTAASSSIPTSRPGSS
jgi:hypothetical protein